MTRWVLEFKDGRMVTVTASDLRAAIMTLPSGELAAVEGRPDDLVRVERIEEEA